MSKLINLKERVISTPKPYPEQPPGLLPFIIPPMVTHILVPVYHRYAATWKIYRSGLENIRMASQGGTFLIAGWHQWLLTGSWILRNLNMADMISPVYEGELIARMFKGMGHTVIRGSRSHSPTHAIRQSVRVLQEGNHALGWASDGPVGPPQKVQPGMIYIASMSRRPILPITFACNEAWKLPTWDSHIVPKPFATVVAEFGEPLWIKPRVRKHEVADAIEVLENRYDQMERNLKDQLANLS